MGEPVLIPTRITVYRPGLPPEPRTFLFQEHPSVIDLRRLLLVDDLLWAKNYYERVRVWHGGEYLDLFVDETGALKDLPRNEAATTIYRANAIAHMPDVKDPEELDAVFGVAILFHRRVWR